MELKEKLTLVAIRFAAILRKTPLIGGRLTLNFMDGDSIEIPIDTGHDLGVHPSNSGMQHSDKSDPEIKKKVYDASPNMDQEPLPMKAIFRKAGISSNKWTREKLWELVESGELISTRKGFRKSK